MLIKLGKFVKNNLFYILSGLSIISIAQVPIILHVLRSPKGFYFPYLDKIAFSDYYYPALIKLGMGNDWLVSIPYVITHQTPSFIQIFFIFLGKFALALHFDAFLTLAIWRVIGGIILLVSAVYFISVSIPKSGQKFVFLLFLCDQPLSMLTNIWNDHYEVWIWHFGEAARRISAMPPHYTVGKGFMIFSIAFWFQFLQTHEKRFLCLSILSILVGAIIYPPPFFILFTSICGGVVLYVIFHEINGVRVFNKNLLRKITLPVILFLGTIIIPMILLKMELAKGYPWNMWNKVELGWNSPSIPFEFEYVRQLGFLLLFLPIVCIDFFFHPHRTLREYWILFWAGSAFVFFPFANFLKLGKFRFTEGMQILPLSIIAFWGGHIVTRWMQKRVGSMVSNFIGKGAFLFFLLYFFLFTYLVAKDSYMALNGLFRNVYLYPEEYSILQFLDSQVRDYPVIISDVYSANFLPAFAHVKTSLGFPDFYESYDEFLGVDDRTDKFLKQQFEIKDAIKFLRSQGAQLVYYPIYAYGQTNLYPSILERMVGNSMVEIYKVKKGVL